MWLPTADGTTGAGGSVLAGDARTEFCSASVDPFVGLRTSRGSAMSHRPFTLILIAIGAAIAPAPGAAAEAPQPPAVDFDRQIAPLLVSRCLECHSGLDPDGGLSLIDATAAAKGGESGPALEPGKTESLLWQRVEADEMPPEHPLPPAEKALLRAWIEAGSPWGQTPLDPLAFSTEKRAGRDWWSLQPLRETPLPDTALDPWARGPIDAWVLERLGASGLAPSRPADPNILIRRLFIDLIGLPPSPEQVDAFMADPSDVAWAGLVDELLASPHYGERWGRHWLDIVRYTESEGFEYDHPRDRAWHYRDYVIRSFNNDKPYDRFMREQLAGDVLEPVTSDGIIATSMLVCGAWDRAGNAQANATQRAITREEEMEDMISVVGQTFLGLTLNCARCHRHKFDPVPQEDYFRIKAVFDGVKHGERPITSPAEIAVRERETAARSEAIAAERTTIADLEREGARRAAQRSQDRVAAPPGPAPLIRWTFRDGAQPAGGKLHGGAEIVAGRLRLHKETQSFFESDPIPESIREKTLEAWVVLSDLDQGGGAAISIESSADRDFDAIVFGERQPRKWIAGSGGFVRTHDLEAPPETSPAGQPVHMAAVYRADNSITLYRNGERYAPPDVPAAGLRTFAKGGATVLLGLRHHGAGNGFLDGEILQAALHATALDDAQVAATFRAGGFAFSKDEILACLDDAQRASHAGATARIDGLKKEAEASATAAELSYVGVRVEPPPTALLHRGSVTSPGAIMTPAGLSAITAVNADLGLTPEAPEAERRKRFAAWIADPANPLPARVIANRIWQYHFGRGLVATPSDFGLNGGRPSHPELLDALAGELVRGGWRLKPLHRAILLSSTYRQASTHDDTAAAIDADTILLWRYPPRRLEAEVVRDAMLAVSGELNPAVGGPSFRPVTTTSFNAPCYHPVDRVDPEYNRRTVYRMNVNSGKEPLLDAFDCPSPSVKTPTRGETITPLQALALMNNSFVQRQADRLAGRALEAAGGELTVAIDRAYELALGRRATDEERQRAVTAAQARGLGSICWALLNSSEFLYVQ